MQIEIAKRIGLLLASSASKPHGTRARYMGGCKCMQCRAAHSRYNTESDARVRAGVRNDLVPAGTAKQHIQALSRHNIGYKSVADAASVGRSIVAMIRNGKRTQIRRQTEQKILSVDKTAIADSALVSARPTWQILDGLISEGFTKRQLANWIGCGNAIQFRRDWITAKSAAKVEKMARRLEAGQLRRDR
jgi:hypothetical protein